MSKEQKMDVVIAFSVLFVVFFMGLFCGRAWACDSYTDCIEHSNEAIDGRVGSKSVPIFMSDEERKISAIKAIAYKLDEISKKLEDK